MSISLTTVLEVALEDPELHARWLNTLSYLENCGARKIAACEHPTMVTEEVLKHAAEESRHAYLFKQFSRRFGVDLDRFEAQSLVGSTLARHYLGRLDIRLSRYLKKEVGLEGDLLKEVAYLLVTYAIEQRAEQVYPTYEALLRERVLPVTLRGLIREEAEHLQEMIDGLSEYPDHEAWMARAREEEAKLYSAWITSVESELHQYSL